MRHLRNIHGLNGEDAAKYAKVPKL
jgi:hypothetical protein